MIVRMTASGSEGEVAWSDRTPDLEVPRLGSTYRNEFKTPELRLGRDVGMYKFSTTNSKLWKCTHEAIEQLRAYDPSHAKPWVITFASALHRSRPRP